MTNEAGIGLADAVRALRAELDAAVAQAEGHDIRFALGTIEMEFLVEVAKEGGADAGVKFWVVNVGASGSVAATRTHRVTLQLKPTDAQGRAPEISDTERAERR